MVQYNTILHVAPQYWMGKEDLKFKLTYTKRIHIMR